ncbi:MAG: hypothetical protein ACRET4_01565 [Steroidobacteraceae bacterium]
MADYEDPGWRSAIWWFVPMWIWKRPVGDGLTALRLSFLALVDALFFFIVMVAFVEPWSSGHEGAVPLLIAVLGCVALVGISWQRRRPLIGDTPERLATNYRAGLFIGIGLAEAPALFGIATTLVVGSWWIYLVGLAFSLIGFVLIAPTRGKIQRRQEEIQAAGSPLSLGRAVMAQRGTHATPLNRPTSRKTFQVPSRVRHTILLLAVAAVFFASWIQSRRPNFDPNIIAMPAVGLYLLVNLQPMVAQIIDRRRRPPPAGTE